MADPRRSRITLVCETCDDTLLLGPVEITAAAEMDLFINVHGGGHDVRMVVALLPDDNSESAAAS